MNHMDVTLLLAGGFLMLLFAGLCVAALAFFRRFQSWADQSLQRRYAGLTFQAEPQSGDVIITYNTYHGVLAWVTRYEHRVALRPDEARILLGRLLRFNLTWSLISYGGLFVPPLAVWEYLTQLRAVEKQETANAFRQL